MDFWAKVRKSDGCWEWLGGKDRDGYGLLYPGGVPWRAHRFAYSLANGEIPAGMVVAHHCDRPSCVRPDHLHAITQTENIAERGARERTQRGEAHWKRRLREEDVRRIRSCGAPVADLAKEYGVGKQAIQKILRRENWKHVA